MDRKSLYQETVTNVRRSNFRHSLRAIAAILANLLPFGGVVWLSRLWEYDQTVMLVLGGVFTILGIIFTVIVHTLLKDRGILALLAVVLFGVAKGCCGMAILYHFFDYHSLAPVSDYLIPLSVTLLIALLLAILHTNTWVEDHPKRVIFPLLLAYLTVAIVFLSVSPSPQDLLMLYFSLTLLFCFGARLIEFDETKELWFALCVASMLYAVAIFLVALLLLSGDGCDDCGCDSCDCDCGDRGSKKSKKTKV